MNLISEFRKSNRGASLVLVSAFSIIIIGIAVTLTVISSMLLSKANAVKKQGQTYEIATSLSARLEEMILNEAENGSKAKIDLDAFITAPATSGYIVKIDEDAGFFEGIPDAAVSAEVTQVKNSVSGSIEYYRIVVIAKAAGESYINTMEFTGNATQGYKRR